MISRRAMLGATGAAAAALTLKVKLPQLKPPPKFFTPAEFALLDELSDLIIPTDDVSAGARAAGVASYIDGRLAESLEPDVQARWRSGLHAVDALSRELHGKAFLAGTPEQRVAVLTKMSAAEADPKTPVEKFFKDLKWWTVFGYYTSKIGIHDDQQYKGNVYQTGEYAGYDAT
jgi:gluconate 2-dehydrogenase subunit 3-like protein